MAAERKLVPTGLRLEPEVLDRLRAGERGLSDEIRDRLQRTFTEDALDPVVREVRDLAVALSEMLEVDYGRPWHQSPRGHQAFMVAMADVLAQYEPVREPGPPVASDLLEGDIPPEPLGQIRAQDVRRRGSYPHLEAAAKHRAARIWTTRNLGAKQEGDGNG